MGALGVGAFPALSALPWRAASSRTDHRVGGTLESLAGSETCLSLVHAARTAIETIGTPTLWFGFIAFVVAMLALDLGVLNRRAHVISVREALTWTAIWVALSAIFCAGIYWSFGAQRGLEFATGYLLEKALAVDNIFVFAVLFRYFGVPPMYQHRVLFWGIFGALVMRAAFIALGASLIARFHFVLYVFGAILIVTGIKLSRQGEATVDPGKSAVVRWFRRTVPSTPGFEGSAFVVHRRGRWMATPLLLVLVVLEVTDVLFALDSIPAIFAVTLDPFIVFTSNIFAILGLRSMYFLLSDIIDRFRFIKVGLSIILCFVGFKMLVIDVIEIPVLVSLSVVVSVLAITVVASLIAPKRPSPPARHPT